MSQYPTDLSGGGGVRRASRLSLSTDMGGSQANISVQGLEPLPVGTRGMQIANELAQSFGLFAQLGGTIDQVQRRQEAAQAQEDAKVEQFDRGQAVRAAANTYAELEPAIRERKMIAAVDDKDLGSYVETLIASRTDRSMAPAWRDEYSKQLHGRLLNAFGQQRAGIQKEAKETALQSLRDRAFGARKTVEIMDAVNAAKETLGLSDMDAHAATTIPALRLAAQQGDREKFKQAVIVLPQGMFADEVAQGQTKLDATRQKNALDLQQANETEFAGWFEKDPTNLPPYETAIARLVETDMTPQAKGMWRRRIEDERTQAVAQERQTVEDMIGSALSAGEFDMARKVIDGGRGKFGDEWGLNADNRVASYQAKVADDVSKEYETRWRSRVSDEAVKLSMRAFSDGTEGLSQLPDEISVMLPDEISVMLPDEISVTLTDEIGVTLTNEKSAKISREDVIDAVRPKVFAMFDEKFPNDPRGALAEKARWLSSNGVTAPEWRQIMDAGAAAATEDALSDPARAQAATRGFLFYRQLSAQDAPLAQQMVSDRTRKLYDTAEGLLADSKNTKGVNPAWALLQASKIMNDPMYGRHVARADSALESSRNNRDSLLIAAAKKVADGGVVTRDLQDAIQREARPLIIGGKSPEDAVNIVAERYKKTTVLVGGANNRRPINLRYEGFSDQFRSVFPSYSETILDAYHADEGKTQGYDRKDLSMVFDAHTSRFAIVDPSGDVVRTTKGLSTIMFDRFGLEKTARSLRKQKIIDRNARRQEPRQFNIPDVPEPPMGLLQ